MCLQSGRVDKGLDALIAFIRLLASVGSSMIVEMATLREPLIAEIALKWLFPGMRSHVNFYSCPTGEFFGTDRTLELFGIGNLTAFAGHIRLWFHFRLPTKFVISLMIVPNCLTFEALVARGTFKRLFTVSLLMLSPIVS